jgi:hypothetical protein
MDARGSIIFDYGLAAPPERGGKRAPPAGAPIGMSQDHPLHFPSGAAPLHGSITQQPAAAEPMPLYARPDAPLAGRPTGVARPIRYSNPGQPGGRTAYQHPSYEIRRSPHDTGAKDLLYPSARPAPSAARQGTPDARGAHPFFGAYQRLAAQVPFMPRDADGNADDGMVRSALMQEGFDISLDGFAELLARCDVAPEGFPAFEDFLLCLSRPHREPPPSETPVVMGGGEALPPSYASLDEDAHMAPAAAPAPPEPSAPPMEPTTTAAAPPPQPAFSDEQMHTTWRHMDMQKQKQLHPAVFAPSQFRATPVHGMRCLATPDAPSVPGAGRAAPSQPQPNPDALRASFPLGVRSHVTPLGNNYAAMYSKSRHTCSQKFTNSFPPDAYLY